MEEKYEKIYLTILLVFVLVFVSACNNAETTKRTLGNEDDLLGETNTSVINDKNNNKDNLNKNDATEKPVKVTDTIEVTDKSIRNVDGLNYGAVEFSDGFGLFVSVELESNFQDYQFFWLVLKNYSKVDDIKISMLSVKAKNTVTGKEFAPSIPNYKVEGEKFAKAFEEYTIKSEYELKPKEAILTWIFFNTYEGLDELQYSDNKHNCNITIPALR
ncbi:MAG TPA: hypothetical protein GXX59_05665 [Syntrophomonadaceae bacterium]|nr:hypothetical protein [Syntrophomonadaceae bacterium]